MSSDLFNITTVVLPFVATAVDGCVYAGNLTQLNGNEFLPKSFTLSRGKECVTGNGNSLIFNPIGHGSKK